MRRHLWVLATGRGICGVIRAGFRYTAIEADGSIAGRRFTLAAAQLIATRN